MKEPQSFDENIIYLVGEITRLSHKKVSAIFSRNQFDVTVEQFGILVLLWYEEGINQQTVADRLNRDKTTITRVIQNMLRKNLIVKVPDQLDKRNKLLYLTEKGRSLNDKMIQTTGVVYIEAQEDISPEDLVTTTRVLQKMKTNLSS